MTVSAEFCNIHKVRSQERPRLKPWQVDFLIKILIMIVRVMFIFYK